MMNKEELKVGDVLIKLTKKGVKWAKQAAL